MGSVKKNIWVNLFPDRNNSVTQILFCRDVFVSLSKPYPSQKHLSAAPTSADTVVSRRKRKVMFLGAIGVTIIAPVSIRFTQMS